MEFPIDDSFSRANPFFGVSILYESSFERIESKAIVLKMIRRLSVIPTGIRTWRRPLSMTSSQSMKVLCPIPRKIGAIERVPYRETDLGRDISSYHLRIIKIVYISTRVD